MDNKVLYEETVGVLLSLLRETIDEFTKAYDVTYGYYDSHPLFSITSPKLKLMKAISHFSNYQVRNEIAKLCKKIHHIDESESDLKSPIKNIDFYRTIEDKKVGYYVSMNEEYMPDFDEARAHGIEKLVIIVLKNKTLFFPPNSTKYRNYADKHRIQNISLEEYFENQCPGEYEVFQEYIGRFNYEAEIMLGLTVNPIPTRNALQKKWDKIKDEFSSYFYLDCLQTLFTEKEVSTLKENFETNNFLQVTNVNFADSFVSSEWYYDLFINTDTELEQTAIVSGYLKSIEQLLFSMMLSKSDTLDFKLRMIKADKNDNKYITLSKENKNDLLTMAGSLLTSIDINYGKRLDEVYIDSKIGETIQKYLHNYISHTRNGFFHKDNIYTQDEIKEIRKSTYCAYFLLGSAFKYDLGSLRN